MSKQGLFIAGTDTEVGKTVVACRLLVQLRQAGIQAVGMKPVASGMTERNGQWVNEDVEAILQATNHAVDPSLVNLYCYQPSIAPHLAADMVGQTISIDKIERAYRHLASQAEMVVVEGAGGIMTPLNAHETFVDLVQRLSLPVILVVAIRLGCINHALLTVAALQAKNIPLVGWVANYVEPVSERNLAIEESLGSRLSAPNIGILPYAQNPIKNSDIDISQFLEK